MIDLNRDNRPDACCLIGAGLEGGDCSASALGMELGEYVIDRFGPVVIPWWTPDPWGDIPLPWEFGARCRRWFVAAAVACDDLMTSPDDACLATVPGCRLLVVLCEAAKCWNSVRMCTHSWWSY